MHTKEEIIENLQRVFGDVNEFLNQITEEQFVLAPEGKWSNGQQVIHLIRSIKPIAVLLQGDITQIEAFGKLKRTPWDYDTLVQNYLNALNSGGKAPKAFEPKVVEPHEKAALVSKFAEIQNAFMQSLDQWDEEKIDQYCIPHPLLGNFSIREMLFFTVYHTLHHLKFMKAYALG